MSKGIGPYGVAMPFERCETGEEYSAPGPVTVRQMTPEERKKYGPPKPVPIGVRINQEKARKARLAREIQQKGDDQMPALDVEQGQDWHKVLTRDKYIELKRQGKSDLSIRHDFGIKYASELTNWKKENGCEGVRLRTDGSVPEHLQEAERDEENTPLPPAQAANQLQAEIDANVEAEAARRLGIPEYTYKKIKRAHGVAGKATRAPGLTIREALEVLPELEADADCCKRLLDENQLTGNVTLLVERYYHDCQRKLDKIYSVRVVI